MARYRLSDPAKADIIAILRRSEKVHGKEARTRYRAPLTAAMRCAAAEPSGPLSTDRADLLTGVRSLHSRHCRGLSEESKVGRPVHVIVYRLLRPGVVEIMRVLHERMEASRHIGDKPAQGS